MVAENRTSATPRIKNQLPGFGYDAAGNMTSNSPFSYTYNGQGQLKSVAQSGTTTFYPFGPKLLRIAWHAAHQANISYAGVCVPIPGEWFVYHSHSKLIIIKAEAVFARNMFDIGYAYIDPPKVIVPFEKYKESLRHRENSEVFSNGGLEFACTDWDEPPTGFVNSCVVQDKVEINFAGSDRYRPDFRDLVHGMTACPVEKHAKSEEIPGLPRRS